MRATVIMAVAVLLFVLHRWATNKPAVTLPIVLSGLFAIFVIGVLDSFVKTQSIARGFAWLFFIGAAYAAIPALTGAIGSAKGGASKGLAGEGINLPGGGG